MQKHWYEETPFLATDAEASEQQWLSLVEKTLKGSSFEEELVTPTLDGIRVEPLYRQSSQSPSLPAAQPQWYIRQSFATGNPVDVNTQILAELEGGVSAIELCLDTGSPDTGISSGAVNQTSVDQTTSRIPCQSLEELELLLTGVFPEMLHVSLQPGSQNQVAAALLDSVWRKQNIDRAKTRVSFNADPLGTAARTGHFNATDIDAATNLSLHTRTHYPDGSSLCVDTSVYHNAGASEAQELGFAMATGVQYLKALTDAGFAPADACRQLSFRYSLDSDFFLSIAKLRAAALLWSQILKHCGITEEAQHIELEAQSGNRCLTRHDPWVNILRVTTQAFAALIGGAGSFNSASYDAMQKDQSSLGRRIARNTQLILLEESKLQQVQDPLAGSGFIDAMTTGLSSKAWDIFQGIESRGGMWQTLKSNHIQELCEDKRAQRRQHIATGRATIVGVSAYPDLQALANPVSAKESRVRQPLAEPKTNAEPAYAVNKSLEEMCAAIDDGAPAAQFYSTTKEASQTIEPLQPERDASVFEHMLARSDYYHSAHKKRPTVICLTLGKASDYAARTNFCRNFFAIAGIETTLIDIEELDQYPASSLKLVVLCSSGQGYKEHALDAMDSLTAAGAATIWIAGKAGALEALLRDNGLARELHIHSNRVSLLSESLSLLEVQ